MKAIVYTEYGPPEVLQLKEIEKPVPKDHEILIQIYAAPVNYGDLLARNFKNTPLRKFNMPLLLWLPSLLYFGITKPRVNILGSEFAGEIEAVGNNVTQFKAGDQVFGYRGLYVADGSLMPTALGANPVATITALSEWIAHEITGAMPDADL